MPSYDKRHCFHGLLQGLHREHLRKYAVPGRCIHDGAVFRAESESLVGPVAERAINDFNARVAFLGTDGFSVDRGLTTQLVEGGQVGSIMRTRAQETWLLADSSKYGEAGFVTFMGIDQVTGIITDDEIPEESIKELAERTKLRNV